MNKEVDPCDDDELCDEYDLAQLEGGVRGKYLEQYNQGTNSVLLDPDVAKAFPIDEAVNEALRMLIRLAQSQLKEI